MATYSCDPNVLIVASSCFIEPAMGDQYRRAIELHARVKELSALGGANYDGNISALMKAALKWRLFHCNQREAIATYRTVQDSIVNGSGISSNVNALKKSARCYVAIGKEDQKNLLAFLGCSISTLNKADGGD
jgi:hypothetical protein